MVAATRPYLYRRVVLCLFIIISFIAVFKLHAGERTWSFQKHLPADFGYKAGPLFHNNKDGTRSSNWAKRDTLDLVVTIYKENQDKAAGQINELRALEPFQNLTTRVFIYTKDPHADVEKLKEQFNTTLVRRLQNVGREAGTYLHHIVENWDDLARHQLFMQAEMHHYEYARDHIIDYFDDERTGVLSLGLIEKCNCIGCKDPWDYWRTYPRLEELYAALNGDFCPKQLPITYFGQFMVSARRIRSRSKNTYSYIKQILESGEGHWIHSDPRQDIFRDDSSNPYFGHTVERSWLILFGCDDPSIAERCGGHEVFRQRRHHDQPLDHCQCLDPKVDKSEAETGDSYRKAISWIKGFREIKSEEEKEWRRHDRDRKLQ